MQGAGHMEDYVRCSAQPPQLSQPFSHPSLGSLQMTPGPKHLSLPSWGPKQCGADNPSFSCPVQIPVNIIKWSSFMPLSSGRFVTQQQTPIRRILEGVLIYPPSSPYPLLSLSLEYTSPIEAAYAKYTPFWAPWHVCDPLGELLEGKYL